MRNLGLPMEIIPEEFPAIRKTFGTPEAELTVPPTIPEIPTTSPALAGLPAPTPTIPPPTGDFWGGVAKGVERAAPYIESAMTGLTAGLYPETARIMQAARQHREELEFRRRQLEAEEERQRAQLKLAQESAAREEARHKATMERLPAPEQWNIIYDRAKTIAETEKIPMTEAIRTARGELEGVKPPEVMSLKEVQGQVALQAYKEGRITLDRLLELDRASKTEFEKYLELSPKDREIYHQFKQAGTVKKTKEEREAITPKDKVTSIRRWLAYQKASREMTPMEKAMARVTPPAESYEEVLTYAKELGKRGEIFVKDIQKFAPPSPTPQPKKKLTKEEILKEIILKGEKPAGKILW